MAYAFRDSNAAARRLRAVSEVFAETSREFLLEAPVEKHRLAVDLGCGPGYSTHLLAKVLQCERVVGLDNSEHFISLAKETETEKVSFSLHDVTTFPFPTGQSNLLYCRFLLTHLKQPRVVVAKWMNQLYPKGNLLIEEVEWINTQNPIFATYLNIVEALLKAQSNNLYVGPVLDEMAGTGMDKFRRTSSKITRLKVSNDQAAKMFFLNFQSWKLSPFIQANYSSAVIKRIGEDLETLARQPQGEADIEWGLRQIILERT